MDTAHKTSPTDRAAPLPPLPRALGLPPGSVRALVAMAVVGVFVMQTLHGEAVGLLMSEALLIVLAHYFASRRLLAVPRRVKDQLLAQGLVERESNPLWLPRNSVRVLILGALLITVGMLLVRGELFQADVFDNLFLVFAYLIGVVIQAVRERLPPKPITRMGKLWVHLKALFVLLACALIALFTWAEWLAELPGWLEKVLLGWILFYFGSR